MEILGKNFDIPHFFFCKFFFTVLILLALISSLRVSFNGNSFLNLTSFFNSNIFRSYNSGNSVLNSLIFSQFVLFEFFVFELVVIQPAVISLEVHINVTIPNNTALNRKQTHAFILNRHLVYKSKLLEHCLDNHRGN